MKIKLLLYSFILITTLSNSQNQKNSVLDSLLHISKTQKEIPLIKTLNDSGTPDSKLLLPFTIVS